MSLPTLHGLQQFKKTAHHHFLKDNWGLLIQLLTDPDLGTDAADGFSVLVSDSSDVLNKATHADIRIMYRQRFFTENVPKLVQGFHSASE
eukprot:g47858.t1